MSKRHEKDAPLTFILFPNPKKDVGRGQPDWVGKIILEDGTIMRLAGWQKEMTNANGDYIGGKMNAFLTKEEVEQKKQEQQQKDIDIEDLPF